MVAISFVVLVVVLLGAVLALDCGCAKTPKPDPLMTRIDELIDIQYKIANELSQMNLILDNKKDVGDYDPVWKDIPGMEKSDSG